MQTIHHTPLHGDGKKPMEHLVRYAHEWALEEYEYDSRNGVGVCTYERTIYPEPLQPEIERHTVRRSEPNGRHHEGWRMWTGRYTFAGQFMR